MVSFALIQMFPYREREEQEESKGLRDHLVNLDSKDYQALLV